MSITYYTGKATLFYKLLSLLPFFQIKKNLTNITLMHLKIYFDSDWKKKFSKKKWRKIINFKEIWSVSMFNISLKNL